ncbi:MAG: DUF192 domain-containing protein [Sphingomonadaceae bacterium]
MRSRSGPGRTASFLVALALAVAPAATPAVGRPPAAEAPSEAKPGKPQTGLRVVPLTIETSDGRTHRYRVEVAETAAQQAHGMMFRTSVPAGTGMIFPMRPPRPAAFWMQNTLVSLDLVFIGADGRVRNIAERAVPRSEALLASAGPVAAVLELAGGEAERIGLRPGDRIRWPG